MSAATSVRKMTIDELKNYRKLTFTIRYWKNELSEMRRKSLVRSPEITGMPMGSNTPDPTAERAIAEAKIINRIERLVAEQEAETERILAWIQGIEDPMIQVIMHSRYIRGKSWAAVAYTVGGGNSPESVRKMHTRYLSALSGGNLITSTMDEVH